MPLQPVRPRDRRGRPEALGDHARQRLDRPARRGWGGGGGRHHLVGARSERRDRRQAGQGSAPRADHRPRYHRPLRGILMVRGAIWLALALAAGACAQVLGVDGVEIADGPGAGGSGSATAASSASTSAGSTSSTASGAGGGGGMMPPKENCTNGIDDDG